MNRFDLYAMVGVAAFLAVGELGVYLQSELVVYGALVVGVSSIVPMWVDVWNKFTTSTEIK